METGLMPIGDILAPKDGTPNYPQTYRPSSTRSTQDPPRRLLHRRPMVRSNELPEDIIGTNHAEIVRVLAGYQRVKERIGWDQYAEKINQPIRDMMDRVFRELRRHGYFNPRVYDDKILLDRLVFRNKDKRPTIELCGLCERECQRKDPHGVFRKDREGDEVRKCWEAP